MFNIRNLCADDIEKISLIEKEVFKEHAWSSALFFDELNDATKHYLVALFNNELIGYGGFAHIGDEAHIMNIAIAKHMQNKGFGYKLTNALLKKAESLGICAATLEVSELNLNAIKLYQKLGFVYAGKRTDYYNKGEAALIFWLYLS